MVLSNARQNEQLRILFISDQDIKAQLIRFGLTEGTLVMCYEVIPAGPIIVKKNHQEIAIGRRIAEGIVVELQR